MNMNLSWISLIIYKYRAIELWILIIIHSYRSTDPHILQQKWTTRILQIHMEVINTTNTRQIHYKDTIICHGSGFSHPNAIARYISNHQTKQLIYTEFKNWEASCTRIMITITFWMACIMISFNWDAILHSLGLYWRED